MSQAALFADVSSEDSKLHRLNCSFARVEELSRSCEEACVFLCLLRHVDERVFL